MNPSISINLESVFHNNHGQRNLQLYFKIQGASHYQKHEAKYAVTVMALHEAWRDTGYT